MAGQNNQQPQRKAHYSNGDMSSYDSYFSAMAYRQYNQAGMIDFSNIDPNFVGKQSKKGDKVYDHENRVSVFVTPTNAMIMKQGLLQFRAAVEAEAQEEELTDQVRSIEFDFGSSKFTFFAPGTVKVKAGPTPVPTAENYLVRVTTNDREKNEVILCHVLQSSTVDIAFTKASESEGAQIVIQHDLDLLLAFLDGLILLGTGVLRQGAQMAIGHGGGGGGAAPSRRNSPTPSFDDDEEEESENIGKGGKAAGKPKPRPVSALDEEFDDVPQ